MDKILNELNNKIQEQLQRDYQSRIRCDDFIKKETDPKKRERLESSYHAIDYRCKRLAIVSDVLMGRAYTVVEKGQDIVVMHDPSSRLISLAEKWGLSAEHIKEIREEQPKML